MDVYSKYEKSIIAIKSVTPDRVNRHGIISGDKFSDKVYKINELVEKPEVENAPSNLAIVGRYILTQDIFDKISETELILMGNSTY